MGNFDGTGERVENWSSVILEVNGFMYRQYMEIRVENVYSFNGWEAKYFGT